MKVMNRSKILCIRLPLKVLFDQMKVVMSTEKLNCLTLRRPIDEYGNIMLTLHKFCCKNMIELLKPSPWSLFESTNSSTKGVLILVEFKPMVVTFGGYRRFGCLVGHHEAMCGCRVCQIREGAVASRDWEVGMRPLHRSRGYEAALTSSDRDAGQ